MPLWPLITPARTSSHTSVPTSENQRRLVNGEAEDNVRVGAQRCYGEDWRSLAEPYENFVQLAFAVGEITLFLIRGQPSDELALDAPILAAHRWMPMADQAQ